MVKSKQTYLKREKEEKRKNKKKEKEEKKEARKSASNKGKGFDNMIAYVDENGHLSDTPPDLSKRKELKLEDIQLGARKPSEDDDKEEINTGRVSYYNEEKGYGFIKDNRTKESIFFHLNNLDFPVKINDQVSYQKTHTIKGTSAAAVHKID